MRTICLVAIILICLFIAPVYADSTAEYIIDLSTTEYWLVADGTDSCIAIAKVSDTAGPIPNLEVKFSVLEPEFGTFDTEKSLTNASGFAVSRFTVNHKSGNATITASVNEDAQKQYIQQIDHDTPYMLSSYDVVSETTVGTTVPITMQYQDRWGNPVDSKRIAEKVTFMVSSPAGDALFLNSNSGMAAVPVNDAGEAIATLQVSKKTAINTVRVNPDMGTIPDKYFFIQSVADGTPVQITQEFDPEPPELPINDGRVIIIYTVLDEFGNGITNTPVNIKTSIGEDFSRNTNSVGQVMLAYGPKDSIGSITFTASATGNSTLPPISRVVSFVAQEIQNLQFTAAPSSMPSHDVDRWQPAILKAKLTDKDGNPVANEIVTFTLGEAVYEQTPLPPTVTANPELSATSALTDSDGFASVEFVPGGFTTDKNDPNYDDSASGSCSVTASWNDDARQTLQLSWKNYPYLSIETSVTPQTVKVGDTVDITVMVKGDGWALLPTPIDAVLCTDRSLTMLNDEPDDRMVPVMEASKAFTDAMQVNAYQDHIGLVSFGGKGWANLSPPYLYLDGTKGYTVYDSQAPDPEFPYSYRYLEGYYYNWNLLSINYNLVFNDGLEDMDDYATQNYYPYTISYDFNSPHQQYIDAHYPGDHRKYDDYAVVECQLSNEATRINTAIDSMVPNGKTPLRYGIYQSIKEIQDSGRPETEAIRAIIVLSDGDYNAYGDPLARGNKAQTSNPVSSPYQEVPKTTPPTLDYWPFEELSDGEQNLSLYAKQNNIRIYSIAYGSELSTYGTETLRILAESTGGKYYSGTSTDIDQIYQFIAEDLKQEAGVNTMMNLSYESIEVNNDTVLVTELSQIFEYIPETVIKSSYFDGEQRVDNPQYTVDQSDDYNQDRKLEFPIGTINLGDIWEATYSLNVLTNGTINVFGPESQISFTTTEGASQTIKIPKTFITSIEEMEPTPIGNSTITVRLEAVSDSDSPVAKWRILRTYNGTGTVKQDIYISLDGKKTWILWKSANLSSSDANSPEEFAVVWNEIPAGAEIVVKVIENAPDAPQATATSMPAPRPQAPPKNYIKLK